jgi:hypothetical protein
MRAVLAAIIIAAGIGFVSAYSASATPANGLAIAGASQHTEQLLQVKDGCGRGRHREHGHCVGDGDRDRR